MKVILTEAVDKLGQEGEVKEVANGYARNFLFPRNLAIPATAGALKQAEARRMHKQREVDRQLNQAQQQAGRLNGLSVLLFARTGEQNRLYGSITVADIAAALKAEHGVTVDRRKMTLDNPVHRTGKYIATINLGRNVTARVNVDVESEANRAEVLEARRVAAETAAADRAAAAQAAAEEAANQSTSPLRAVADTAGTVVAAVGEGVGNVAHAVGDTVGPALQNVGDAVAPVLQNVGDTVGPALHTVGDTVGPALEAVRDTAGNALSTVTEGAGSLLRRVTGRDTDEAEADTDVTANANMTAEAGSLGDDTTAQALPANTFADRGDAELSADAAGGTLPTEAGEDIAPYTRDDVAYLLDTPVAQMEADLDERRRNPQPGDPPVLPE